MIGLPDQDEFVVTLFAYDHGSLRPQSGKAIPFKDFAFPDWEKQFPDCR